MLKKKLCEAVITWRLKCDGPLLIADGRYEKTKGDKAPHKVFISRTPLRDVKKKVKEAGGDGAGLGVLDFYVPATSIRGPFRAQAERIIRTLYNGDKPAEAACDPFEQDGGSRFRSCGKRLEGKADVYKEACLACKLFGLAGHASRITFADADVRGTSAFRDMIGIDRFTGGVYTGGGGGGGANMRFHVLEGAEFETKITVVNFELWQLGLMAYVLKDFEDGLVQIGFGKSKGFGAVKGEVRDVKLFYPKERCAGRLVGVGSLVEEEERKRYGFVQDDETSEEVLKRNGVGGSLSLYEKFIPTEPQGFWKAAAAAFNGRMDEMNKKSSDGSGGGGES
ncbi:MAG TPA: hypothetical protein ENJ37_00190 [Deltaproteobacteria bacterium]|nr:hypothetical protein [Deltaproteobacteria bacterium]